MTQYNITFHIPIYGVGHPIFTILTCNLLKKEIRQRCRDLGQLHQLRQNYMMTYSSVSLILTVFTRRSLCKLCELCALCLLCELCEQGRTGHLVYRAYAWWTVQYWGRLGPKNAPKCPKMPFGAQNIHQNAP